MNTVELQLKNPYKWQSGAS